MTIVETDLACCEACGRSVPWENAHRHVDVWMCDNCDAEWRAQFDACVHDWEECPLDYGPGRVCAQCSGAVEDDVAAALFPLICDGWVQLGTADA